MNEAQTLTLEAGKYYRTRGGEKAFVVGVHDNITGNAARQVVGFIYNEGGCLWSRDGVSSSRNDDGDPHRLDLVAEWVEPKRIKGWINIYPSDEEEQDNPVPVRSGVHDTRDNADKLALRSRRIACIEIDVLQGHGLGEAA